MYVVPTPGEPVEDLLIHHIAMRFLHDRIARYSITQIPSGLIFFIFYLRLNTLAKITSLSMS